MDLSVQKLHLYLSVCLIIFGVFHCMTDCVQTDSSYFCLYFCCDDDCPLIFVIFYYNLIYYLFITLATRGLFITMATKGFPSYNGFISLTTVGFLSCHYFVSFVSSDN